MNKKENFKIGDIVKTKDGYRGTVVMFGEDNSMPPKDRLLIRLESEIGVTLVGRRKGYYPHELIKIK